MCGGIAEHPERPFPQIAEPFYSSLLALGREALIASFTGVPKYDSNPLEY